MTSVAKTANSVSSTMNAVVSAGSSMFKLLSWMADPHAVVSSAPRRGNVLMRPASVALPTLMGGSDLDDLSDMASFI